ncbi:low-density lipoprotein receptor-related protein 2-like [Asterias amurensis]|uniref:low-density lipoprotein receptor-related protein 2-like n=1 Tax=Asterias amurensis TaxID=7602 RepID=UPI003AB3075D
MEHSKIWILVCLFATHVRWVDADAYVLVSDLDNGTIYKGSILQGLADLTPLPLVGLIRPVAVDFDPVEQMVYWTDIGKPSPKISRAHLDGSDQRTLIYDLYLPLGLALDVTSRMVYWTDGNLGHIARIPMDGSGSKEVIVESIIHPWGIITDHDYGHIYWADTGNNGTIERANLDGTDRTAIVQHDMKFPSGLAIDHRESKLYWCDHLLDTIEQSDLNGNFRAVVLNLTRHSGTFQPFDLFLLEDNVNVYLTDWGPNTLIRVSKTGVGEQNYGPKIFQQAGGIHIYEDFCDSSPCMNGGTCGLSTAGFTCQCASGFGGEVCQSAFCDSSPCMNGGRCTNSGCLCTTGYRGNLCQIDFCESYPCMNGGTCYSLTDDFTCHCAPGYEGDLCEFGGNNLPYGLIIGSVMGVVTLIVVVLLIIIIIKRKRTRRPEERVIQLPDIQTIYNAGQTNPQYQQSEPPPRYSTDAGQFLNHVYADMRDLTSGQQHVYASQIREEKM